MDHTRLFDINARRRIKLEATKNRNKKLAAEKLTMLSERKDRIWRVNKGNMIVATIKIKKIQVSNVPVSM